MLYPSAEASVHGLIRYSLHIKSNELTHFFTERPFSFENLWLFFHFILKQWLMAHLMEAYNEPTNEFWYLSHMCKISH